MANVVAQQSTHATGNCNADIEGRRPAYHVFPSPSAVVATSMINSSKHMMLQHVSGFWLCRRPKANMARRRSRCSYVTHMCQGQICHEHVTDLVAIGIEQFKPSDDLFVASFSAVVLIEPHSLQDG
jgi:hypothetical protein